MLPSVQLYDHLLFKVHKIYNITANWLLATKLETCYLSVSQIPPQMPLCIRGLFSKSSCYARKSFHPHPLPSPLKGEGFLCPSVCFSVLFHQSFDNILNKTAPGPNLWSIFSGCHAELFQLFFIDLNAEPRPVGQMQQPVPDLKRLL